MIIIGFRVYIYIYRDNMGIMEKKMETTIVYRGYTFFLRVF